MNKFSKSMNDWYRSVLDNKKKGEKKIRDIEQFNEITFTANYDKRSEYVSVIVPDKGFFFSLLL